MSLLDIITTRRSVSVKDMCAPGPSPEQLQSLLQAAHRVPDHGKLGPWRFVIFTGDARADFSRKLADIYKEENPDAANKILQFQAELLTRAPLVIAVISTAAHHVKVPEWEQVLSAGAACQNILLAAHTMGFGAQWLTEWYGYNAKVHKLLGMEDHHRVAGFIYVGSYKEKPEERVRPSLEERVHHWNS
ncbi:MAG: nitroreductase [Cellvibrionaceae bacterium]|nr:nitroreductase [Cellvibrionaceae bacterium]